MKLYGKLSGAVLAGMLSLSTFASEKSDFQATTKFLEPDGVVYDYNNGQAIVAQVDGMVKMVASMAGTELPGFVMPLIETVLKDSGFRSLRGYGMSSVDKGDGIYSSKAVLYVPADQNSGIFWNLYGKKAHDFEVLKMIPANAFLVGSTDVNLAGIYAFVKQSLVKAGADDANAELTKFEAMAATQNIDVEKLLASMDGDFTFVLTYSEGRMLMPGLPISGAAFFAKFKDDTMWNLIKAQVPPTSIQNDRIMFPAGIMTISISKFNNYLIVSTTPGEIEAVGEGKAANLTTNPEFKKYAEGLKLEGNGIQFISAHFWNNVLPGVMQMVGMMNQNAEMPDVVNLVKQLGMDYQGVSIGMQMPEGYLSHAMLNRPIQNNQSMATPAILSGMLLPALNQSREQARMISCMNNLKQTGVATKMYQMDHNQLPQKDNEDGFAELGDRLNAKALVCPSNSEYEVGYVFLGGMADKKMPAETPLAFDIPGNHGRGVNMLFVDGHVELLAGDFITCGDVIEAVIAAHPGLPEEVQKNLRAKAAKIDEMEEIAE